MMTLMLLASTASAVDWDALYRDRGWAHVSNPVHADAGRIVLDHKKIDDLRCLRGTTHIEVPSSTLYEVVVDVPGAKRFSSETLLATRVIGRDGDAVDFYQHLAVPVWTLASNRFWVLRGRPAHRGNKKIFRWQRFPWRKKYPGLAEEIAERHAGSIEPFTNWGSWTFTPAESGTDAVYYVCSDGGGAMPEWLKQTAATSSIPNTMGDIIREARRRMTE